MVTHVKETWAETCMLHNLGMHSRKPSAVEPKKPQHQSPVGNQSSTEQGNLEFEVQFTLLI